MACEPGQSSGPSSRAQDSVCDTLTTVERYRVNFLCIWLALVASVPKGIRRVWARSPSAHAEVMGTNGFTALWRGLVTDTIGPEGERAIQYQSVALFTKGWYYSAGISMTNCLLELRARLPRDNVAPWGERRILSAIEVVSASRSMAYITGRSRVFIPFYVPCNHARRKDRC